MRRTLLIIVAALALVNLASTVAIADEPKTTEVVLDNGLTVILRENHNAPVISTVVGYRVGVRNEYPGVTGLSHLVEHMNYKGTKNYSETELKREIETSGEFNGMTGPDSTMYYQTVPRARFEDILAVEADRMGNCLFKEEDFLTERSVVVSELEGMQNNPIQRFFSELLLSFIRLHPYRYISLAQKEDVRRVSRDTAYNWYKKYYVPNNAVLTVVGDFDTDQALALVRKHFDPIPRGADVDDYIAAEPPVLGPRRIEVNESFPVPIVAVGALIPGSTDDDIPALSVLNGIMAEGRMCRLYRAIVDAKLGEEVASEFLSLRDLGALFFIGVGGFGADRQKIEDAIVAELQRVIDEPVTYEEINRVKKMAKAQFVFGGDTMNEIAIQLCTAEMLDDWQERDRYLDKIDAVTAEDVRRVAKEYLGADRRGFAILVPGMGGLGMLGGGPGGSTTPVPMPSPSPGIGWLSSGWEAAALLAAPPREPVRKELANGLVVIVQEDHTYPTVSFAGEVQAGSTRDPKGKEGLANLVASTLNEGTESRDAEAIASALEGLGADLSFGAGKDTIGFDGSCLAEDIDTVLEITADCVRHPIFPQDEIDKAKRQIGVLLAQQQTDSQHAGLQTIMEAVYPEGHAYRHESEGTAQTLATIGRDDLVAHHATYFRPDDAALVIVGDITADSAFALAEKCFGDWAKRGSVETLTVPKLNVPAGLQRIPVPMADKVQDDVFIGFPTVGELDKDARVAELVNVVLGGAFTSRIPQAVRHEEGLAYVSNSGIIATQHDGIQFVYTGTNPDNVNRVIELVNGEIHKMRESGMTEDEMVWAKRYLTERRPITLETAQARAVAYRTAEHFGRPLSFVEDYPKIIDAISLDQANAAAKRLLPDGNLFVVIAGPEVPE
jgi:zinc protease